MKKVIGLCISILLLITIMPIESGNILKEVIGENNKVQPFYDIGSLTSQDNFIIDIIQQINETLYLGYLENITAFGARVTGSPECHSAGDYIYSQFESLGLDVRFHNWSYSGYADRNVEATINGIKESNKIYIICAHFDSVSGSPGADDDGSGVAAVLSAANILHNYAFNYTIRFVTFSGEEQWMLGSHEYVREAYENGDNIIAVLNCDMIGFAIDTVHGKNIKLYRNEKSNWICDFTIDVSQVYYDYIKLNVNLNDPKPGDQSSFWDYNYDCILNQEYEFNYYYHSSQDIIENMNITYATKISKLVLATLTLLAEIISSSSPDPPTISGPTNGKRGQEYDFTVVTIDPDGDNVFYYIDWGDNTSSGWVGPNVSGEEIIVSHSWFRSGIYEIRAKAKDPYNLSSWWSETFLITIINHLPNAPIIDGPTRGKKGVFYNFTFNSVDPDGDDVYYFIDWGDGCTEDWNGPHLSGVDFVIEHSFPFRKTFRIKSKAKDDYGAESDWGEFEVAIPRNRPTFNSLFNCFLARFPMLEKLLSLIRVI